MSLMKLKCKLNEQKMLQAEKRCDWLARTGDHDNIEYALISNVSYTLATFCDNILKKGGSEKLSDEAVKKDTLMKVVKLLSYISDIYDLALASENQSHFEEYCSNNLNVSPGIDLTTVLTTGVWPSY
ncbi:hypothetical protein QVD17_11821 [Tagetes erecta]|uniref:Uncharacterized protein n=1 Tax=Tagetes erecta TaxID=13708 RepID=A0AAD8KV03_TARER|nr:hypothetical protein QVD17_11821 [Tagetes erecta]